MATPAAAAGIIGAMVTAIRKVHAANGPWATDGGFEYNAVLIAACLALADDGPGDLSLDAALGTGRSGVVWAGAALAAGVAASTLTVAYGTRKAAVAPTAYPTAPGTTDAVQNAAKAEA